MSRVIFKSALVDDDSIREIRQRVGFAIGECSDPVSGAMAARAEEEVRRVLVTAGREAESLLSSAQAEAALLRESARQAGFEEGHQAGWTEARSRVGDLLKEAMQILASAEKERAAILRDMEREIVELALAVAGKVTRRQVALDREIVVDIARETLRLAMGSRNVFLHVTPELVEFLQEKRDELEQNLLEGASLQFVADGGISRGGCRVETELVDVHATVEEQLNMARTALLPEEDL